MLGKREIASLDNACVMLSSGAWTMDKALEYLIARNQDEVLEEVMFHSALYVFQEYRSKICTRDHLATLRKQKLKHPVEYGITKMKLISYIRMKKKRGG